MWVAGTWVPERHGYRYENSRWVERVGHWHHQPGGWSRWDRDGDGVANRYAAIRTIRAATKRV